MQTRIGSRLLYDNFQAGVATHPANPDEVYLAFTDNDNEETHMFLMTPDSLKKYEQMIREASGPGVIIAGLQDMPNGGPK